MSKESHAEGKPTCKRPRRKRFMWNDVFTARALEESIRLRIPCKHGRHGVSSLWDQVASFINDQALNHHHHHTEVSSSSPPPSPSECHVSQSKQQQQENQEKEVCDVKPGEQDDRHRHQHQLPHTKGKIKEPSQSTDVGVSAMQIINSSSIQSAHRTEPLTGDRVRKRIMSVIEKIGRADRLQQQSIHRLVGASFMSVADNSSSLNNAEEDLFSDEVIHLARRFIQMRGDAFQLKEELDSASQKGDFGVISNTSARPPPPPPTTVANRHMASPNGCGDRTQPSLIPSELSCCPKSISNTLQQLISSDRNCNVRNSDNITVTTSASKPTIAFGRLISDQAHCSPVSSTCASASTLQTQQLISSTQSMPIPSAQSSEATLLSTTLAQAQHPIPPQGLHFASNDGEQLFPSTLLRDCYEMQKMLQSTVSRTQQQLEALTNEIIQQRILIKNLCARLDDVSPQQLRENCDSGDNSKSYHTHHDRQQHQEQHHSDRLIQQIPLSCSSISE